MSEHKCPNHDLYPIENCLECRKEQAINDDWDSKSIYLSKKGESVYIGLHAVGAIGEDGEWHNMDAWLNVYGLDRKFQYSASRIFGHIEEESVMLQKEGWEVITDWKD